MLPTLATLARDAGLKVVEVPGWQTRGRPTGGFAPVGILCHHTATGPTTSDDAVIRLLVDGRADLPGPLCQLGLGRDGTVYVIAAGRANHAGTAKAQPGIPAGDGNTLYVGIEAFNSGTGEPWPDVQRDAYVRLCAALCRHLGSPAESVRGHKETSVTGKIDPTFDMTQFRADVAHTMEDDMTPEDRQLLEDNLKATTALRERFDTFAKFERERDKADRDRLKALTALVKTLGGGTTPEVPPPGKA